tara:strand:+ start:2007 stop:2240 length:234 start_codon:yes stop_codon:yes gene_type:complete
MSSENNYISLLSPSFLADYFIGFADFYKSVLSGDVKGSGDFLNLRNNVFSQTLLIVPREQCIGQHVNYDKFAPETLG